MRHRIKRANVLAGIAGAVVSAVLLAGCQEPEPSARAGWLPVLELEDVGDDAGTTTSAQVPAAQMPVRAADPRPEQVNRAARVDRLAMLVVDTPSPMLASPPVRPEPLSEQSIEVPKPVLLGELMRHDILAASRHRSRPDDDLRSLSPPDRGAVAGLRNFFGALAELDDGSRERPVRILHLGDSHIASDMFTRGLRAQFQQRFGDAGRGMMQPPNAFRWHRIEGIDMSAHGWTFANSLTEKTGPYGITGVRATTSSADAVLEVSARHDRFDRATLRYMTGPGQGQIKLRLGDQTTVVSTSSDREAVASASLEGAGSTLRAEALGNGPVTVLGWSLEKNQAGVQYANLGIPGAAIYSARAWSPEIIKADVREMAPDLIILGYGSNDAFNTNLTEENYHGYVRGLLDSAMAGAPGASILIIGPSDGASKAGKGPVGPTHCQTSFGGDFRTLPRLKVVQTVLRQVADETGAAYWDWAQAMGGTCSIGRWASMSPPLAARDLLHLTPAGYERSSTALFDHLMRNFKFSRQVAQQTR